MRRKSQYFVGFIAVVLGVLVTATLSSLTSKIPAVFLKSAEGEQSQYDFQFQTVTPQSLINYRLAASSLGEIADNAAPRLYTDSKIYNRECRDGLIANGGSAGMKNEHDIADWMYYGLPSVLNCNFGEQDCLAHLCYRLAGENSSHYALMVAMDVKKERELGIGRDWPYKTIPKSSVVLPEEIADKMGYNVGDIMPMFISMNFYSTSRLRLVAYDAVREWMKSNTFDPGLMTQEVTDIWERMMYPHGGVISLPMRVHGIIKSSYGKTMKYEDRRRIFVDLDNLLDSLLTHVHPLLKETNVAKIARTTYYPYPVNHLENTTLPWNVPELIRSSTTSTLRTVSSFIVMVLPDRINQYISHTFDETLALATRIQSSAIYLLGFGEIAQYGLAASRANSLRRTSGYMNLVYNLVFAAFFIVSFMMIYSFLMLSVESRLYDFGVHRLMGMTRGGLVALILSQTATFAVPAFVLGVLGSIILTYYATSALSATLQMPLTIAFSGSAVLPSFIVGFGVPVVSALIPIKTAISKSVLDALETRRSKVHSTLCDIDRSKSGSISVAFCAAATIFIGLGFAIYYLLPYSLITGNNSIMFTLFGIIIIGCMIGLSMLALNFELIAGRSFVSLFFFYDKPLIISLTRGNFVAHRRRNRQTSLMFILSVAFIVLLKVLYQSEADIFDSITARNEGAPIAARCYINGRGESIFTWDLVQLIEGRLTPHAEYVDWAFVSEKANYDKLQSQGTASSMAKIAWTPIGVRAVTSTLADASNWQYTDVKMQRNIGATSLGLSEAAYSVSGGQGIVMSESVAKSIFVSHPKQEISLELASVRGAAGLDDKIREVGSFSGEQLLSVTSVLTSVPGLQFGIASDDTDSFVSIPTFLSLAGNDVKTVDQIAWKRVLIKPKATAERWQVMQVVSDMNFLNREYGCKMYLSNEVKGEKSATRSSLALLFDFSTVLIMFLCFFSLVASMYANVRDSTKEIGVLRALGLTKWQVTRVFLYESFSLVAVSSCIGVLIGFLTGWGMAVQQEMLMSTTVQFIFPWGTIVVILVMSAVFAKMATLNSIKTLWGKTTSEVLRLI